MPRALAILALLLPACASEVRVDAGEGARAAEEEGTSISFQVVVDEATCGVEESLRQVVRTRARWARLWETLYRPVEPRPRIPQVNFSQEMLIAVGMGTRRSGGYDISVGSIVLRGETLEVRVDEFCPPPDAVVSMSLTQPVQVVRLQALEQAPVFRENKAPSCD